MSQRRCLEMMLAAKLGLSRQTLYRNLRAEGVTFEQVRRQHARSARLISGARRMRRSGRGLDVRGR